MDKYNRDNSTFMHFLSVDENQGGSHIWKNAKKFKHILRRGVKWKVGNGLKVHFWEDTWILDHCLCDDPRWNGFMAHCKLQFGNLVSDY